METIMALGAWNWMILAAILFVLELTAPGIFFMWFGFAAAVTGIIAFRYDVAWQWQLIWFCALSLAAVLIAAKYLRKHPLESERPLLNERAVQLIGQSFDLVDPIVNGRGSIKTDLAGGRARIAQRRPNQSGRCRRHSAQGRCGGQRSRRLTASSFDFLNRGDLVGDIGARIIVRP
jgi:inner membrane protein